MLGLHSESPRDQVTTVEPSRPPSNFDILSGVDAAPAKDGSKIPEQDLLGGSPTSFDPFASLTSERLQPSPQTQANVASKKPENDLFSSFSSFDPFATNAPKPNSTPSAPLQQPQSEPDLFDPFKTVPKGNAEPNLMGNWATNTNISTASGQRTQNASSNQGSNTASFDPFADLASFGKPAQPPPKSLSGQNIAANKSASAPMTQSVPKSYSPVLQTRQSKPNYSVNFNPSQQNWKASKLNFDNSELI